MKHAAPIVALAFLAAACSRQSEAPAPSPDAAATATPSASATPLASTSAAATPGFPAGKWEMVSSGEGDGLFFGVVEGEPGRMHLFCENGGGLLVNVNAFRPIGSEERLSLGSGDTVVALVADPAGDANRGGVTGTGAVPAELAAILAGAAGLSASYGAQSTGPLPPVPDDVTRAFVRGCTD